MAKKKKGKPQNKSVKQVKASVRPEEVVASPESEVEVNKVEVSKPNQTETNVDAKTQPAKKQSKKDKNGKVVEVKAKDVKKESKPKKPNKLVKKFKDTGAELKKVTWPKFKDVVKQTGIVLVVVLVFALVLLGLDSLCSLLTGLLLK